MTIKRMRLATAMLMILGLFIAAGNMYASDAPIFTDPIPKKFLCGTWKVVYSSSEGPEGRALEELTKRVGAHMLRDDYFATQYVLPLEKDGGPRVMTKRDAIVIGIPSKNKTLRDVLGEDSLKDFPAGGYLIKTYHKDGRNIVAIAGDTPSAVLWGVFEFLDVVMPNLEMRIKDSHSCYVGTFFRASKIPSYEYSTVPETPIRSAWTWGHVINDYNASFREMAKARLNRAIIWNDQQIINAKEVVECAHSWGVEVYWGFAWGWGTGFSDITKLDELSKSIVDEWRRIWKPMGGDGIYFQSFTETYSQEMGGRLIADIVTDLVNMTVKRIREESPETKIIFGLHASSIHKKGATEAIARTDPSVEILWEDCGGFPFCDVIRPIDWNYCDKILALTPTVGFCWKGQLRIDWAHFKRPLAGPFYLGCAGERLVQRDRAVTIPRHVEFDERWIYHGKSVYDFVKHVRQGKNPPKEFSAVAEYNPPYSFATHCQAELFWSTKDSWDHISRRARARARPER